MTREPVILQARVFDGYTVELHERADPLGFLARTFWVAPALDGNPFHAGTGQSPAEAIAAMRAKQDRIAA